MLPVGSQHTHHNSLPVQKFKKVAWKGTKVGGASRGEKGAGVGCIVRFCGLLPTQTEVTVRLETGSKIALSSSISIPDI